MSYVDHLELPSTPAGDISLWRYLSLAQFLNVLDDQILHFTRIDHLADLSPNIESQVALSTLAGISAESTRRSFDLMKRVQSAVFVNSWYEDDLLAHPRPEIQVGDYEVAIRTTVDTLKKALRPSTQRIHMASVQYIDFASSRMPTGNIFIPSLHKQHRLQDEKEVRLLLLQTGGQAVFSPGPERGIDVKIDAAALITGVRINPRSGDWSQSQVLSLADRHSLTFASDQYSRTQIHPPIPGMLTEALAPSNQIR